MTGMCPHCGKIIRLKHSLITVHNYPKFTRQVCPGSKQNSRSPDSDLRPLWNGKGNPHTPCKECGNTEEAGLLIGKCIDCKFKNLKGYIPNNDAL